ncbi:MAG: hypothetical protein J6M60_07350 [Clostridia bacterium]|nr:hypothetical protein [Clostridia bacterium]MBP3256279.1 hypothetical protein [Clostridia bacterium]
MFFIFNKSKICSYLVSVGTVAVLLVMGFYISENNETMQTSSNIVQDSLNNIENNITNEAKDNINNAIQK